jgi:hypothetical protein
MSKITSISTNGKTYDFEPKEKLSDEKLNFLIQFCCDHDGMADLTFLSKSQQKQLIKKALEKAESYSSTHSMRYSIMRDVTGSLFNVFVNVYVTEKGNEYNVYKSKGDKKPIATFTYWDNMDKFCREKCFKYNGVVSIA